MARLARRERVVTQGDAPAAALPSEIERAMYGFLASQVLFVGDEIGAFDRIAAAGTATAEEIAPACGVHPAALDRLLLAAVSIGLLDREAGRYSVPAHLRGALAHGSPDYAGGRLRHYQQVSYGVVQHMRQALVENAPQWQRMVGGGGDYKELYASPERLDSFLSTMWALGHGSECELVDRFPLGRFRRLCDLGGGSGSFAIAALERTPGLEATVFDLPPIGGYLERHQRVWLARGLRFVPGDFFADALPPADVYALGYVLSNWGEERIRELLAKVFRALPAGGALLILEKLFDEDKRGPLATAMMHIDMLVETGGQHRTATEYGALLEDAGFRDVVVVRSSGEKHMVTAGKP
jgi:hypothetical protein